MLLSTSSIAARNAVISRNKINNAHDTYKTNMTGTHVLANEPNRFAPPSNTTHVRKAKKRPVHHAGTDSCTKMYANVFDCKLDQLINKIMIALLYQCATKGLTCLRYCMGPPIMLPSAVCTRVETAK